MLILPSSDRRPTSESERMGISTESTNDGIREIYGDTYQM